MSHRKTDGTARALLATAVVLASALLLMLGLTADRVHRLGRRADAIARDVAEVRRTLAALDADIHVAHRRIADVEKSLRSDIEAEKGARGQQVTDERDRRRKDVGRLSEGGVAAVAIALRERDARIVADGQLAAIIGAIGKRVKSLEDLKPAPPSPSPDPAVPTMPPPPSKVLPEARP